MRYWENMQIGERERLGEHVLSAADVAAYRARFQTEDAPIPAMLLCCIYMRLLVDGMLGEMRSLGSPGVDDIRWPAPASLGDTLVAESEIIGARTLESRADMGLVKHRARLTNQHGEIVLEMVTNAMFARRGAAS